MADLFSKLAICVMLSDLLPEKVIVQYLYFTPSERFADPHAALTVNIGSTLLALVNGLLFLYFRRLKREGLTRDQA